jgi:hypothetical protein
MPKFKELKLDQKKKLLREEYLKDGAEESFVDQLIPIGASDVTMAVTTRLRDVFGYQDDMEVDV